jgi:hypothetical protein
VKSSIKHVLPFEIFPIFDLSRLPEILDRPGLFRAASRFLGFSTIVNRVFLQKQGVVGSELENRPRLRLRFFQHLDLPACKVEQDFLKGVGWIEFHGPWPYELLDPERFISELAGQLWNSAASVAEAQSDARDQIQHFSCHCDTTATISSHYSLCLAHKGKGFFTSAPERRASIGELKQEMTKLEPQVKRLGESSSRGSGSLVFLNACGSSKLTPTGVSSFPDFFLKTGSRGVIGTETRIPDTFGAAFSEQFYRHLERGFSIGECVYRARWELLKHYNNPLGILYTIYGDSDLHVRWPHT